MRAADTASTVSHEHRIAHPPVDEGPRVQCGALPPQTSLIGGKENAEGVKSSFIR